MAIKYLNARRIRGSSTEDAPLGDGLKAYYKLNTNYTTNPQTEANVASTITGSSGTDMGTNADISIINQPTQVTSGVPSGLDDANSFNGTNEYGKAGSLANRSQWNFLHDTTAKWTLNVWLKFPDGEPSANTYLWSDAEATDTQPSMQLRSRGTYWRFIVCNASGVVLNTNDSPQLPIPQDDDWHMYSLRYDYSQSSDTFIYSVDGATSGTYYVTDDKTGTATDNTGDVEPFFMADGYNGLYGEMNATACELAIWNRILTNAEITRLYNGGDGRVLTLAGVSDEKATLLPTTFTATGGSLDQTYDSTSHNGLGIKLLAGHSMIGKTLKDITIWLKASNGSTPIPAGYPSVNVWRGTGGKVGTGCGDFDGDDILSYTGNGDMDGNFTVAFWFFRGQSSASNMTAYQQVGSGGAGADRVQIGTQSGGAWEIYASSKVLDGGTPEQNRWYHLALTGNGTTWKWYEDGVEVDSTTSGTNSSRNNDGIVTFMGESGGAKVDGFMDEMCHFDRELSASEVLSLADGSKKPDDASLNTSNSLVLYLPMDTTASSGLTNWYDDKSATSQAITTSGNPSLKTDCNLVQMNFTNPSYDTWAELTTGSTAGAGSYIEAKYSNSTGVTLQANDIIGFEGIGYFRTLPNSVMQGQTYGSGNQSGDFPEDSLSSNMRHIGADSNFIVNTDGANYGKLNIKLETGDPLIAENTLFEETDTRKCYFLQSGVWEGSSPDFVDNFSTYANQTAGNTAWVPASNVAGRRVNIANDNLELENDSGTTNYAVAYDLGAGLVSDTKWVLRFSADVTLSSGTNNWCYIGLFNSNESVGGGTNQNMIAVAFQNDGVNTKFWSVAGVGRNVNAGSSDYFNATGNGTLTSTKYYIQLSRTSATSMDIKIYSDSTYETLHASMTASGSSISFGDLRYIKFANNTTSGSGSIDIVMDDVKFVNGVTSI